MDVSLLLLAVQLSAQPASSHTVGFSHEMHIGTVGLTCTDCHTAVPDSDRQEDRLFPSPESCFACHPQDEAADCPDCGAAIERLRQREQRHPGVIFSHRGHLGSDLFLAQLHGRSGSLPEAPSESAICLSCHQGMERVALGGAENYPSMADCLSCHQPEGNAMAMCRACHTSDFNLRPPSHLDSSFFDQHSSDEFTDDLHECSICHTPGYNPCTQCH